MSDAGLIKIADSERLIERFVLAVLYFTLSGDRWRFQNLWLSDTSLCGWFGVGCTENGNIESIELCKRCI